MLSLRISDIPTKSSETEKMLRQPRRLAWDKAGQQQLQDYQARLQAELSTIPVPDTISCIDVNCTSPHHSRERDEYVIDVMSKVIEAGHLSIALAPAPKKSPTKVQVTIFVNTKLPSHLQE